MTPSDSLKSCLLLSTAAALLFAVPTAPGRPDDNFAVLLLLVVHCSSMASDHLLSMLLERARMPCTKKPQCDTTAMRDSGLQQQQQHEHERMLTKHR
jgi:hypothetical protein